jgi:hypothetical protein
VKETARNGAVTSVALENRESSEPLHKSSSGRRGAFVKFSSSCSTQLRCTTLPINTLDSLTVGLRRVTDFPLNIEEG